jgi:hypothetical protein
MIGRLSAELDCNRMSVQVSMRPGARQRDGIEIRANNQASAASAGDPG